MHVLLVEDSPSDVRLFKELMEEEQHAPTIQWVIDGYEALDYIYQRNQHKDAPRPDVVLLDLGLPRISGYDVLRELKANPEYRGLPVIILTTSCSRLEQSQCHELGADSFISKPRNLKEFHDLVHRLVHDDFPRLAAA